MPTAQHLHPEAFPLLRAAAQAEGRLQRLDNAISVIKAGIESGVIPNPALQDAKFVVGRSVEKAWEICVSDPFVQGGKYESLSLAVREFTWTVSGSSGLHAMLSVAKKVSATKLQHPIIDAMRALTCEILPLAEAAESLKDKVVKRKIKTPEEKTAENAFVPPLPSLEAAHMVYRILLGITERHFRELVDILRVSYTCDLDAYVAKEASRTDVHPAPQMYPVTRLTEQAPGYPRRYVKVPNADKLIADMALRDAQSIRDHFIAKNLNKIAAIIEAKGGLSAFNQAVVRDESVSLEGMRGVIRFTFKDGSAFTVKNAVVRSRSIYDRPFRRFPLTFHDVLLPGGGKMSKPSEERMNDVFAKALGQDRTQ